MSFFRKEKPPEMPPLVEIPKAGEPIVFDEEEQQWIDAKVQRQWDDLKHDTGKVWFPEDVTEFISANFAADALRYVVQQRLSRSDLKGAASMNIKLLGIAPVISPNDWLTLAKIFALHGDSIRAMNFISAANETYTKLGCGMSDKNLALGLSKHELDKGWKIRVQEVKDIIDSIQQ